MDLKSRLKNLESAEAQLEEIMKQATETEDVVNVFNQLVYYREQIELVKGQMNYGAWLTIAFGFPEFW